MPGWFRLVINHGLSTYFLFAKSAGHTLDELIEDPSAIDAESDNAAHFYASFVEYAWRAARGETDQDG